MGSVSAVMMIISDTPRLRVCACVSSRVSTEQTEMQLPFVRGARSLTFVASLAPFFNCL